jgi:hypothetical protein
MRHRLVGWLLLTACSGGTEPGTDTRLVVLPAQDTLPAGSTVQLRAVLVDGGGDTTEIPSAIWSSGDPDAAPVSASGTVTGIQSSQVTIVALAGELRGTAEVRVERRFRASAVGAGAAGICALDLEGRIWCQGGWGAGTAFPAIDAGEIRTFLTPVHGDERYTAVGSNSFFACGLSTGGKVLCWGYQPLGDQLSAGVPTSIAPDLTFDTLSVQGWLGCGLVGSAAHCWGVPVTGIKPVDTGGIPLVKLEVQEGDACGLTAEDLTLCWDEFGSAYADNRTIVPPDGLPALKGIVSGRDFFCGRSADGLAWCWGSNESGQLGNGTTVNYPQGIQVAGGHVFSLLSAPVDGSGRRVCGIAEENELYCWGAGFGSVPAPVLY